MIKSICALVHREDLDRGRFQHHYENRHVPLAIRHFPFTRYVRNHLLDAQDIGYDTISEFWAEDIAATAALMDGPVGDIMRADEERFMNRARTAPAGAEEHVLSAGEPALGDGTRIAALIDWHGTDAEGREAAMAWGVECASAMGGISLDFTTSWREPPFPSRAILWMPQRCDKEPGGALQVGFVRVKRIETAASELSGIQAPL